MAKNVLSKIINIVSVLIIILAVTILVSAVFTKSGDTPSVMGHSFLRVLTGSMEPEIPADSIVITREVSPKSLKVGDVITFHSRDEKLEGVPVTHRIVAITTDHVQVEGESEAQEQLIFTTKGDANALVDKHQVFEPDIVGKVVFHSHVLGRLVKLVSNPLVFFPLVIIPMLLIVIDSILKTVRSAKQIAKSEEEEAIRLMMEEIKKKKAEAEAAKAEAEAELAALEQKALPSQKAETPVISVHKQDRYRADRRKEDRRKSSRARRQKRRAQQSRRAKR